MDEKARCLTALQEKSDAQTGVLQGEPIDWDAFDRLVDEKDALIDELDQLDDGFALSFERIKEELQGQTAQYREEIAKLQEQIRAVTEQSAALMATEQRNQELATRRFSEARRGIRQNKTTAKAAANYYATMNKINYIDAQLMDKKK